ncbi:MAG: hypothetical protein WBH98_03220 [Bacteroidales bacterium]
MKKLLILILALVPLLAVSQQLYVGEPKPVDNIGISDCMAPLFKKPGNRYICLCGDVRIVVNPNEKADFNVIVAQNAALTVKVVKEKDSFFSCGIWRWVDNGEDFSIRFVEDEKDAHFSINFTKDHWYGCRVCDD